MHAPVLGGGLISRTLLRTGSPSFVHASPTGARRRWAIATAVLSLAAILLILPCAFGSDNLSVTGTASIGTLISGTASIDVLDSGTATVNTLSVPGDPQNPAAPSFLLGISGTNPAFTLSYSENADGSGAALSQFATNPLTAWNWLRPDLSGSTVTAMQLDASNRLILTGTGAGAPQIVLDPNGTITAGGCNLLTQDYANSLYLPANSALTMSGASIGIGTTNPQATLDVNGTVRFDNGAITSDGSGNVAATSITLVGSTGGWGGNGIVMSDYEMLTWRDQHGNTNDYPWAPGQSGLGIWMSRSDQEDNISIGGDWPCTNLPTMVNVVLGNQPGSAFHVVYWGCWGWADLFHVDAASGNVGIGTASPQNKLDVQGDARFTGAVYIAPQGDLDMGDFTADPNQSQQQSQSLRSTQTMLNSPALSGTAALSTGFGLSRTGTAARVGVNQIGASAATAAGVLTSGTTQSQTTTP